MLKLFIDSGNGPVDYTHDLIPTSLKITDSINVATLVNFSLVNNSDNFVVPPQGAYFQIYSTKYNKYLVTGFISNAPSVTLLGVAPDTPSKNYGRFQYDCTASSDLWLLNVKTIPFIPAYMNVTEGELLSNIAQTLAPGVIDTSSAVASGDIIPFEAWSPQDNFTDVAKNLADSSRYHFFALNKKFIFQPFNDQGLGIKYDEALGERTFDPYGLQTKVLTVPPVNDAIVIGDIEPQNNWDDYFIGDGFSGNFKLTHSCWHGASAVLLQEDWNEQTLNTSVWNKQDPQGVFTVQGLLNAVGGDNVLGDTYILAQNGLELGGKINLQLGEVLFEDRSIGILGGLYDSSPGATLTLNRNSCIAGFWVSPVSGSTVIPSPSGATNMGIQGMIHGQPVGFQVPTKENHHYILQMVVDVERVSRYNRTYRTLACQPFGGNTLSASGSVTFIISDVDLTRQQFVQQLGLVFPAPTTSIAAQYSFPCTFPPFALYSPANVAIADFALAFTLLSLPPQAALTLQSLYGPTGGQLPIRPQNLSAPFAGMLGFGLENQVAQITQADNVSDELSFYPDDIPAVGGRARLQSWDGGNAYARVLDPANIASTALISGDDGHRSAIFTNLSPLPRSSEECAYAAIAAIKDREAIQWQGQYAVMDDYLDPLTGPAAPSGDYPRSGRYLLINAPARGISAQQFFVTQVTYQGVELQDEKLQITVSFGRDNYLEKLLTKFLQRSEPELLPADLQKQPSPLTLAQVGTAFLPNLDSAHLTQISGSGVLVDLGVVPVSGVEVRLADTGWAANQQYLIGTFTTRTFYLPRTSIDQTWYMRQVNGPLTSRFTKALRVLYPLIPDPPALTSMDLSDPTHPIIALNFAGDIRNIYGLEVRDDLGNVVVQKAVAAPADLTFTYDNSVRLTRNITLFCYFFNLMWEYSAARVVPIHFPTPQVIKLHVYDLTKDLKWCVKYV